MITKEDVADLQPGDVVRVSLRLTPDVVTEGPVTEYGKALICGPVFLRYSSGAVGSDLHSLTVVSRAPRPLYVNHPRTEPVAGDVVRDADKPGDVVTWSWAFGSLGNHGWRYTGSSNGWNSSMPARLRLLVDGETGMTVPS